MAALVCQLGKNAAAVLLAHEAGDQALVLQPADHAGQRTLTQVDRLGDRLDLRGLVGDLSESLEHFVLTHAQSVVLQLAIERTADIGVSSQQLAPFTDIGADLTSLSADLRLGHGGDVIMQLHSMQAQLMTRH